MDANAPDTDVPGVYRQSSVPLSIDPTDQNAMQQAMSSALMERYPAQTNFGTGDPETIILQLLQLLQQKTAAPAPQAPAMPPPMPPPMPPQMGGGLPGQTPSLPPQAAPVPAGPPAGLPPMPGRMQ